MRYPVRAVTRPASLSGQQNGKVAPDRLRSVVTPGGTGTFAAPAESAWVALCGAAERAGHTLVPFSTYRSYEKQEALFLSRYKTIPKAGADTKFWKSRTWWCHVPPTTAAPGTSNHGWGLAVDVRVRRGGTVKPIDEPALAWLLAGNALAHGFSWEIQSEPWHIRYFAGDNPPTLPEDDDMDEATFKTWVREVLNEGTGDGQKTWASTSKADLATSQQTFNYARATAAAVARLAATPASTVNTSALAAEIVDLMDDDFAAAVANELKRRLES